ncbi:hypothetical protein PPL_00166 [Heterostelium album PN500]|uniref:Uncharacterized protein n=1 Tax=Heterostelium pallidum (strain ATCC 26659 / Pp 5 / PN500) TaxID=670386 RepID=D3AVQ1_HETP5|nr:hypothetical protein PPL_00166 [Heterostelium album PN500]EFA86374.1 hypothetical protein PPL_00166 [Heterostelium album PN500]|eukprot:XP_020438479.1 hypothetical protein PPL_00166 [Heterostelium album PN500]
MSLNSCKLNISNWYRIRQQRPNQHTSNFNSFRNSYCTTNNSSNNSNTNTNASNSNSSNSSNGSHNQHNEKVVVDDVHNKHFINNEWMEKRVNPFISIRTGRILTAVTCTLAFYLSIVSEYDDEGKETVVTGIRNYHDKIVSEWLGFDVRKSFKDFDSSMRDVITVKPMEEKFSQEAIDLVNQMKQQSGSTAPITTTKESTTATTTTLVTPINAIDNDSKQSTKKLSEADRIDQLMRKSRNETSKWEQQMDIAFETLNAARELKQSEKNSSNKNNNNINNINVNLEK